VKTKYKLYLGIIIPAIFWLTTFICGIIQGNYNHFSRLISELGTAGTRSQFVFSTGLMLCSISSMIFLTGLKEICTAKGISSIPVMIILFYAVSIAGIAVFPLPDKLHGIAGIPSMFIICSPILGLILWWKKLLKITLFSNLSILFMLIGFLAFLPDVFPDYPGLKQRFFHIGWSVWFIYLNYSFIKLAKPLKEAI